MIKGSLVYPVHLVFHEYNYERCFSIITQKYSQCNINYNIDVDYKC